MSNSIMTEINNFNEIYNYIEEMDLQDNEFIFLQILQRKKDGNDRCTKNSQVIKNYFVYNLDYLKKKQDQIIELCNEYNARAYIRLNRRHDYKIALTMLEDLAGMLKHNCFAKTKSIYEHACGSCHSEPAKTWIVDLDGDDVDKVDIIAEVIDGLRPREVENKIKLRLNTLNGIHLITSAFDLQTFKKTFPDIDVHKDNPTLLYYREMNPVHSEF